LIAIGPNDKIDSKLLAFIIAGVLKLSAGAGGPILFGLMVIPPSTEIPPPIDNAILLFL
jgi:hypothetical protein